MIHRKLPFPIFLFIFLLASPLPGDVAFAAEKNQNAAVDKTLARAKKWPGVIRSNIGVTRRGTKIPCLLAQDGFDYGTKKTRILLIGGLDGSPASVELTLAVMKWFHNSAAAAKQRERFSLSCVAIANPDGWATKRGPGNLSGGNPATGYPPKSRAYNSRTDPEAQYLWRWIGMHAPDLVIVLGNKAVRGRGSWRFPENADKKLKRLSVQFGKTFAVSKPPELIGALWQHRPANVGRIPAIGIDWSAADPAWVGEGLLKHLRQSRFAGISSARKELQRRIARSPLEIARQLSKKYGHDLNRVTYIPALALIGRLRLGRIAGNASHRQDVVKIVAPYFSGMKPTFGKRIFGSMMPGHLVFGELARREPDPQKRARYITLARRAADLGFDKNGKPKPSMPAHVEMSDSLFMGCPILTQVGKLTGETKYFDMAVRHMRFMRKLDFRKDGLYRNSPLCEAAWGRGNGFPALGLAISLSDLPKNHPGYEEMLNAFQAHMAAMAIHQDPTGMWHQIVDRDESYRELTVTCMTTFAMIRGIRNGWLAEKTYRPIVQRAFTAIKTRIATNGSLVDVCTGTGKQKSFRAYFDRTAILDDDARGGAMALMVTTEMAEWKQHQKAKK